jgi:hypothetical protein
MRKIRICCEQVVVEGGDAGHLRATRFGLPADVIMMFSLSGLVHFARKRITGWKLSYCDICSANVYAVFANGQKMV